MSELDSKLCVSIPNIQLPCGDHVFTQWELKKESNTIFSEIEISEAGQVSSEKLGRPVSIHLPLTMKDCQPAFLRVR